MKCPKCSSDNAFNAIFCDQCGAMIREEHTGTEAGSGSTDGMDKVSFVEIYLPPGQQDLALVKMILDREEMIYYVNNEYASRWIGPFLTSVGAGSVRVMVQRDRAEEAKQLLKTELGLK